MNLLIDTHALLWYVLADPQLSGNAQSLILDPANEILVSPASYWEIAIKISVGKLNLHKKTRCRRSSPFNCPFAQAPAGNERESSFISVISRPDAVDE